MRKWKPNWVVLMAALATLIPSSAQLVWLACLWLIICINHKRIRQKQKSTASFSFDCHIYFFQFLFFFYSFPPFYQAAATSRALTASECSFYVSLIKVWIFLPLFVCLFFNFLVLNHIVVVFVWLAFHCGQSPLVIMLKLSRYYKHVNSKMASPTSLKQ